MFILRILKNIVSIIALSFAIFGFIIIYYLFSSSKMSTSQIIIIEYGLSTYQIANKLAEAKIITQPKLFFLCEKIYSLKHPLKSGEYEFDANITPYQALIILALGKSIAHKLVIPEGVMVSEILKKINDEPRLFGENLDNIAEGSLFPETYFYIYGETKQKLVNQMRQKMTDALNLVIQTLPSDSVIKTKNDILILASIVEKETRLTSEKPLVAAVFINRLQKHMRLQADPTTVYALTEGKFVLPRALYRNDLLTPSPYNTYYVTGLPPTPISCPGMQALAAIANAPKTSFLYFVADGLGGHNFSSDLSTHIKNVQIYKNQ